MDILQRLGSAGVIPVVVLEDAKDAVPTANALLAGGVDVMEITFRTAAAPAAIRAAVEQCPDMLVGAGTVITLEQCREAVECGARFIVSPGFDASVVKWCVDNGVAAVPGCVTPTEITAAMGLGLQVVKFFPANVYGGLTAMKSLSGPFGGIKFIPTGGVNSQNLSEYISAPFVHAVGGSWLCAGKDIAGGRFDKITALCTETRRIILGYEVAHVGINTAGDGDAQAVAGIFGGAFGFPVKNGGSSVFASTGIEIMKSRYLGGQGHIAVRTNRIGIAIADLEKKGFAVDMSTAKYKDGKLAAVYLENEIGGFAVHLLQK